MAGSQEGAITAWAWGARLVEVLLGLGPPSRSSVPLPLHHTLRGEYTLFIEQWWTSAGRLTGHPVRPTFHQPFVRSSLPCILEPIKNCNSGLPSSQAFESSWALGMVGLKANQSWAVGHSFIHSSGVYGEPTLCQAPLQHREPWGGGHREIGWRGPSLISDGEVAGGGRRSPRLWGSEGKSPTGEG